MTFRAGDRLGPYEILAQLGAGGMGEVYQARDTRLAREVALKALPESLSSDAGRLKRFEQEARAASSLNHPNIVTIYEIGQTDSVAWIAMELVDGKTLRDLLDAGAMPPRRLLSLAAQTANGLAKAHGAGIVHRDLKPENLMVTDDGFVKILDFGLAKLIPSGFEPAQGSHLPTVTRATEPGTVLGTVGYMSPEQALGQPLDFRSDQFSFGAILYEMATGRRAFQRASAPQTLTAIIQDEPEPIAALNPRIPAPVRWIVERCLAKESRNRYASTEDLARELAALRDHLSEVSSAASPLASGFRRRPSRVYGLFAVALLAVAGAFYGLATAARQTPVPSFRRLTFRRGIVHGARFGPDGQTIIYSGAFEDRPSRVFVTRADSRDSQELPLPDAMLKSVSPFGELAITLGSYRLSETASRRTTLATVPLTGSALREVEENVGAAAWAPDGQGLALVRSLGEKEQLEYPSGRVLYETPGKIGSPHFSPRGDAICFQVNRQSFNVVDLTGRPKLISKGWRFVGAGTWSPSGDEVWFSASETGLPDTIWAMTLSVKRRVLARVPGWIHLMDVSKEHRAIATIGTPRWEIWSPREGEAGERDLSWLGMSSAVALSSDGKSVLFNEHGEGGGPSLAAFLRRTDGSPALKVSDGQALDLSRDGKWVVALGVSEGGLLLVPVGAGQARHLSLGALESVEGAAWFPDGRRLLIVGNERSRASRGYVLDIETGRSVPLTSDPVDSFAISPDGRFVGVKSRSGEVWSYPVGGGERRAITGVADGEKLIVWSTDGKALFACDSTELPLKVVRVDVASGRRELWKTIMPVDRAGLISVDVLMTPDGKSYLLNTRRGVNDLYLIDGLK